MCSSSTRQPVPENCFLYLSSGIILLIQSPNSCPTKNSEFAVVVATVTITNCCSCHYYCCCLHTCHFPFVIRMSKIGSIMHIYFCQNNTNVVQLKVVIVMLHMFFVVVLFCCVILLFLLFLFGCDVVVTVVIWILKFLFGVEIIKIFILLIFCRISYYKIKINISTRIMEVFS